MLGSGALKMWENSPLPSIITGRAALVIAEVCGSRRGFFHIGYAHQRGSDQGHTVALGHWLNSQERRIVLSQLKEAAHPRDPGRWCPGAHSTCWIKGGARWGGCFPFFWPQQSTQQICHKAGRVGGAVLHLSWHQSAVDMGKEGTEVALAAHGRRK